MTLVPQLDKCERCDGRGRGGWAPDFGICYDCGGKGAVTSLVVENIAFMRRWKVTQDGTDAAYRVSLWFVPISGTKFHPEPRTVFLKMTVKGTGPDGAALDIEIEGKNVATAYERFNANDALTKVQTRNTMLDFIRSGLTRG